MDISSSYNRSNYFLDGKFSTPSPTNSSDDTDHSLIQNYEDFYNGIALGILITGILILAFIIVFYYVKNKDQESRCRNNTWTDENGVTRGVRTAEDRDELRRMSSDPPPSYVETVCRVDPPAYKESLMQQELNPEVNPEWAHRQASGNLDKEIQEVVLKRVNSCGHGKLYSLIIEQESRSQRGETNSSSNPPPFLVPPEQQLNEQPQNSPSDATAEGPIAPPSTSSPSSAIPQIISGLLRI